MNNGSAQIAFIIRFFLFFSIFPPFCFYLHFKGLFWLILFLSPVACRNPSDQPAMPVSIIWLLPFQTFPLDLCFAALHILAGQHHLCKGSLSTSSCTFSLQAVLAQPQVTMRLLGHWSGSLCAGWCPLRVFCTAFSACSCHFFPQDMTLSGVETTTPLCVYAVSDQTKFCFILWFAGAVILNSSHVKGVGCIWWKISWCI